MKLDDKREVVGGQRELWKRACFDLCRSFLPCLLCGFAPGALRMKKWICKSAPGGFGREERSSAALLLVGRFRLHSLVNALREAAL